MPIDWSQVAVFVGPFVPDGDSVVLEILDVGVTGNEPEQLVDDRFQVYFLGGQKRKAFSEVEPHLITKYALRSDTGAVMFYNSVFTYVAEEIKILFHWPGTYMQLPQNSFTDLRQLELSILLRMRILLPVRTLLPDGVLSSDMKAR